jgi:hypothetical protein
MKRQSELHTFNERLNAEKALMQAALANTGTGPRRDLLELKLKQLEIALHMGGWQPAPERPPASLGRAIVKDI